MNDHQIQDAYDRLETALAPPPDVAVRVDRLARARRTRRRMTAVGAACVLAAGVGGVALLTGGDDANPATVAVDTGSPARSIVLTRPDGTTYEMKDLSLSCTDPDSPAGQEVAPPGSPQRIWLTSPRDVSAGGKVLGHPFVYFQGIVSQIDGQTFTMPVDDADSDHVAMILFAADPDVAPTVDRPNEVNSAEYGSTGTIVVTRASCDPTPVLEMTVDVTLGSEVEQGTLDLAGSFG